MWYAFFKTVVFVPLMKVLVRPRVVGLENLPRQGGAVLAANHGSAWETLILPASVPRQVTFPAKAELFVARGVRQSIVAWFLRAVGQVPVDRSGGRASADGLGPVIEALESGRVVGIFPEGTRSPDGALYRGKTGVARLALRAGVPVVPVGLVNTEPAKRVLGIPVFRGCEVRIGQPVSYDEFAGRADERATLRWVTDDVMTHIQQLTGQEYFDCTASSVKKGMDQAQRASYALEAPNAGKAKP